MYFSFSPADDNITAYETKQAAVNSGEPVFATQDEMVEVIKQAKAKPVEIWNSLTGVTPVKKFTDLPTAYTRIWKAIQSLTPLPEAPVEMESDPEPERPAREDAVFGSVEAQPEAESKEARKGSLTAEVIRLLSRARGATKAEIMQVTGWQDHTVRGFIAGAAKKKFGLNVESYKNSSGERTYRVVA